VALTRKRRFGVVLFFEWHIHDDGLHFIDSLYRLDVVFHASHWR
jgi:hypothetical protein